MKDKKLKVRLVNGESGKGALIGNGNLPMSGDSGSGDSGSGDSGSGSGGGTLQGSIIGNGTATASGIVPITLGHTCNAGGGITWSATCRCEYDRETHEWLIDESSMSLSSISQNINLIGNNVDGGPNGTSFEISSLLNISEPVSAFISGSIVNYSIYNKQFTIKKIVKSHGEEVSSETTIYNCSINVEFRLYINGSNILSENATISLTPTP